MLATQERPLGRGRRAISCPTLGVDIGGVVVALANGEEDTSFFGTRPVETRPVEGVFDALAALVAGPFSERVYLVSKAGPKVAANSRAWLAHHRFFERTGIAVANLHFVQQRRDKASVCQRFGITHFVDDRLDVLAHLDIVDHRYLFTGGRGDRLQETHVPAWATVASTWADVVAAALATMRNPVEAPAGRRSPKRRRPYEAGHD
jgi:hypothetical protein